MKTWVWVIILVSGILGLFNGFQVTGVGQADAFIGPNPSVIPKDALRLRIIANSDSPFDQNLKREVRDRVVSYIGEKMAKVTTPEEAQLVLQENVPQVQHIVTGMLKQAGVKYSAKTAFAPTDFPTKLYGNRVYPAGVYSALRIVLGKGAGQNWWCVLFPPLCFVVLNDGDAVPDLKSFPDLPPLATTTIENPDGQGTTPVQLRLAVVDYGEEALKILGSNLQSIWRQMVG